MSQYTSNLYRNTPSICIGVLWCPYALRKGNAASTPPSCIAVRPPYVLQYASHLYRSTFGKILVVVVTGCSPFMAVSLLALPQGGGCDESAVSSNIQVPYFRRCPSTVLCTVPSCEAVKISVDSQLESFTQLRRQPAQSSSKFNLFVRVRFGGVPSTVEEVVRVRFCCLLG